jgi:hypothetical protein
VTVLGVVFNNREISWVLWLAASLVWVLSRRSVRVGVLQALKAFGDRKIALVFAGMLAYLGLVLLAYRTVGQLDAAAIKIFVAWLLGVGVVLFFRFSEAAKDPLFFRKVVLDSVGIAVFLEFLINLHAFTLPVELVLVPVVTLLGLMQGVASLKPEHRRVEKFLSSILAVVGFVVFAFTIYETVSNFSTASAYSSLRAFLLPLFFTIAFLPYIYAVALYSTYEAAFMRIDYFNPDRSIRRFAKRKIILRFHVNLPRLATWSKDIRVLKFRSKEAVIASITKRRDEAQQKAAET